MKIIFVLIIFFFSCQCLDNYALESTGDLWLCCSILLLLSLHMAGMPKIWIEQSGFSRMEKLYCPAFNIDKKSIETGQLFSLETVSNIHEKEFIIPETVPDCKKWKLWSIQASNLVAMSSGKSLVVFWLSPSRIIVLLNWTKYVVPHY